MMKSVVFLWTMSGWLVGGWLVAEPSATPTPPTPPTLDYYLPPSVSYDPAIPLPRSTLGFEVGEWHLRPEQQVAYLEKLDASSDRIELEVIGHTYEARPLLLLKISSPANLARLEAIRREHLALSDPAVPRPDLTDLPVVVYLGYSVHGNEASGANAALVVAYHLAAAQGAEIEDLLAHTVILLDPAFNPDGISRFATWANMHRGRVLVDEPDHREHREAWPNGRTNHYWFDLNRDWLPAQHPETIARLAQFHRFRPNVLSDFHEMDTDATYFFQPGVGRRAHPLTPAKNLELTRALAQYHARALDQLGSLYYTEESFDDFYFGKGSTYPDLHGGIGILFEQASARGHLQQSQDGQLSFPFAIRNQVTTSLSTLAGALALRQELLAYQADFYRQVPQDDVRGWVFSGEHDPARLHAFLTLLERHQIVVHELARPLEIHGQSFRPGRASPGTAYLVPTAQPQGRLVRALFERRTEFADATFYDISAWTLPLAFGLANSALEGAAFSPQLLGKRVKVEDPPRGSFPSSGIAYAYVFPWDGTYAPRALHRLLQAGVKARVATRTFTPAGASLAGGSPAAPFAPGAIVIPTGIQAVEPARLTALLQQIAEHDAISLALVPSGLTPEGIDLGSPNLLPLTLPRAALVVGRPVSTTAAGEVWHLLDQRSEIPLTLLDFDRVPGVDLRHFTHLLLVDGEYESWNRKAVEKLRAWVREGGVLVAMQDAVPWVDRNIFPATLAPEANNAREPRVDGPSTKPRDLTPTHTAIGGESITSAEEPPVRRPYADFEPERDAQMISGAIFEVELDLTHPLAFGFRETRLPVFRDSRVLFGRERSPYVTVAQYTDQPLLSGYASAENLKRLRNSPALTAHRLDHGVVVRMADNPTFRAFWYGTQKLLLNALFFGSLIESTEP